MSKKEKLVQCLQELHSSNYSDAVAARLTNATAEKTLNLIFEIGKDKLRFTGDEKRIVGNLLSQTIKPIQAHIERTGCVYRTRLNSAILRKRSALQFLVDDYAAFPAQSHTLKKSFKEANFKESINILNDLIRKWEGESDSEADSDQEVTGLPSSHSWWK